MQPFSARAWGLASEGNQLAFYTKAPTDARLAAEHAPFALLSWCAFSARTAFV
jgi:hypothetical protein